MCIYQHDNVPKHTANATKLRRMKVFMHVEVFKWPPQYTENLWEIVNLNCDTPCRSYNEAQLWEDLKEDWKEIKHDTCTKYSESMPRIMPSVVKCMLYFH